MDLSRVVEESVDRQLKVNRWERLTMVLMLHLGSNLLKLLSLICLSLETGGVEAHCCSFFHPLMASPSTISQAI